MYGRTVMKCCAQRFCAVVARLIIDGNYLLVSCNVGESPRNGYGLIIQLRVLIVSSAVWIKEARMT